MFSFRATLLMVAFATSLAVYADSQPVDSVMNTEVLGEVEVKADMLRFYGTHDEIFLGKENLKYGNNALDAISSLPMFKLDAESAQLSRIDGRSVLVLINGRKATKRELMGLQATDIKKIISYSNPSVEYWAENAQTVIDIKLKPKREPSITTTLNTRNAIVSPTGFNSMFGVYADSVNMVSASYMLSYGFDTDRLENTTYDYGTSRRELKGTYGAGKRMSHSAGLSWQREKKSNFFFVGTNFASEWDRDTSRQKIIENNDIETGKTNSRLYNNFSMCNIDLFYRHKFSNNRYLSLNMVNTYMESQSDHDYMLIPTGGEAAPETLKTAINNYSYSIISQASYITPLLGGNTVISGYFRHKRLNTHDCLNGNSAKIYDNYGLAGITYNRKVNRLVLTATVAGTAISHKSYGSTLNYFYFTPLIDIAYVAHYMAIRLTSKITTDNPTIGMLTENASIIDDSYFSVGNPGLKPSHGYVNELRWEFMSKDQKFYASPSIKYTYTSHSFVPILSKATLASDHREVIVNRLTNIDHTNDLSINLSCSYSPTSWLRIMPNYEFSSRYYRVPRGKIRHTIHTLGLSLQFSYNNFESSMAYNPPFTTKNGDTSWREGSQSNFRIQWKHNSFSIGLAYHYQRTYVARAFSDDFNYCKRVVLNTPRKNVELTFTWKFFNGKSYRHSYKDLSNMDADAGQTKRDFQ